MLKCRFLVVVSQCETTQHRVLSLLFQFKDAAMPAIKCPAGLS